MSTVISEKRWYARSATDGDAHYGVLAEDGLVNAVCSRIFRPEVNPFVGVPVGLVSPADREHACPTCLRRAH